MAGNFDRKLRLPRIHFRVLLHAANLRHGTNGLTSLPKEGVLRIFSSWKIRRLRLALNPRTWVSKASTLTLDHRSHYITVIENNKNLKRFYTVDQERFYNLPEGSYLGSKQRRAIVWNSFLSTTAEDYATHANNNPYLTNALRYGSYRQIPQ